MAKQFDVVAIGTGAGASAVASRAARRSNVGIASVGNALCTRF